MKVRGSVRWLHCAHPTTMREFFYPLPIPLVIGIIILGVVLVLLSCAPTAWVDKAHRELEKRDKTP